MKKPLPLYFWTEPVDGEMCAVHARMRTMSRGCLLGHTVMMLVPLAERRNWRAFEAIQDKMKIQFRESLARKHLGHLPVLGLLHATNLDESADRVGIC